MWSGYVAGLIYATLWLSPIPWFEQARQPLQHVRLPPSIPSLFATDCRPCHEAQYQQWRGSRHAESFTNRIFAASFRREPLRWCVYCHAPLPAQEQALRGVRLVPAVVDPLVAEGINCAVCHVRDGAILGTRPPSPAGLRAHPMRQAPELGRSTFCAGCHQFNFPRQGLPIRYTAEPMQDTLAEWRRAPHSPSCQQCHMEKGSHRFPGGHDVALLRETISARLLRLPSGQLQVTLTAHKAGHRVPTGDPFRRIVLKLYRDRGQAEPLQRYAFGRQFRRPPGAAADAWTLAQDTSIPPPQAGQSASHVLTLPTDAGKPAATFFRLLYSYPAPSSVPDLAEEDIAVELQHGAIPDRP